MDARKNVPSWSAGWQDPALPHGERSSLWGGVGKTAIATTVARQSQQNFECVFWRSLQNAPPAGAFFAPVHSLCFSSTNAWICPAKTEDQILLLLDYLREHACFAGPWITLSPCWSLARNAGSVSRPPARLMASCVAPCWRGFSTRVFCS